MKNFFFRDLKNLLFDHFPNLFHWRLDVLIYEPQSDSNVKRLELYQPFIQEVLYQKKRLERQLYSLEKKTTKKERVMLFIFIETINDHILFLKSIKKQISGIKPCTTQEALNIIRELETKHLIEFLIEFLNFTPDIVEDSLSLIRDESLLTCNSIIKNFNSLKIENINSFQNYCQKVINLILLIENKLEINLKGEFKNLELFEKKTSGTMLEFLFWRWNLI